MRHAVDMDDAKVVAHAPNPVVADELCEVLRQADRARAALAASGPTDA
jgi:hypothetical protein